jgi:hypothetical protein
LASRQASLYAALRPDGDIEIHPMEMSILSNMFR